MAPWSDFLGKDFTTLMEEIMLLNYFCCRIGDFQVLCLWPIDDSPVGKVCVFCWNFLSVSSNRSATFPCIFLYAPAAKNTDATAFQYTGTFYVSWLSMKMDVSTTLKIILRKIVNTSHVTISVLDMFCALCQGCTNCPEI